MNLCQLKETFQNEVGILNGLDHPNIVRFLGHFTRGTSGYIFMEKILGDNLYIYVQKNGNGLSEKLCLDIFFEILMAVDYLHMNNICHHDLKSENVMYDSNNNVVKIIDFGLSVPFSENTLIESNSGSPLYSAPEVLSSLPHDPKSCDVWSLGIILYYMLVGDYPWQNVDSVEDLLEIFSNQSLTIPYPENISSQMQELINKILVVDPQKRYTLSEVIKVIEEQKYLYIAS